MTSPTVSVIIPAYDAARWLREAIVSVLNQNFQDFEIVVVDDGSTDDTRQIVESFTDSRLRYIYQPNRGLSAARNTGIRAALGRYIALLDADDVFKPDKLAKQVAILEGEPNIGLVLCGYELIDESGRVLREEKPYLRVPEVDLRTVLFWNPLLPSTLLIRRVWLDRVGMFDESLRRYEDWDFAVRIAFAGCQMRWVRETLLGYRRHQANMSTAAQLVPVATDAAVKFMSQFFARPDLPDAVCALQDRVFGNLYLDAAARAYGAGLGERGRQWLEMAVSYDLDLLRGDPPRWVVALCGHAQTALVEDWRAYLYTIAAHLPLGDAFQKWNHQRLVANFYAAEAFRHLNLQQRALAWRSALSAIWSDIHLVRNRGLLKIFLSGQILLKRSGQAIR